jgi:hypothetical protein
MPPKLTALCLAAAVGLAMPPAARPQTPSSASVDSADVQRLQDNVYLADRDVSQLRSQDAARADALQADLDTAREDVIYLKVKLRREHSLSRSEYAEVRDHINDIRARARDLDRPTATTGIAPAPPVAAERPAAAAAPARSPRPAARAGEAEIPAATELDVRLQSALDSGTAHVEDRFDATTVADLIIDERTVVPAGSLVRGIVTAVEPGTRTNRTARMTVNFDQLTVGNQTYEIRGTVTEAIEGSGIKGEAPRIGVGAGVGAVIGGLLGGVKGALAGVLIGGGGTIAATEGKEVELPQGSVLRIRIESPVSVRVAR